MARTISNSSITVDGNTVELTGDVQLSADYQTLTCLAESSLHGSVKVVYDLQSETPQDSLEELAESDYTVDPAGTNHELLLKNNGLVAVYGNASLVK